MLKYEKKLPTIIKKAIAIRKEDSTYYFQSEFLRVLFSFKGINLRPFIIREFEDLITETTQKKNDSENKIH
jgi:hypothetical protein